MKGKGKREWERKTNPLFGRGKIKARNGNGGNEFPFEPTIPNWKEVERIFLSLIFPLPYQTQIVHFLLLSFLFPPHTWACTSNMDKYKRRNQKLSQQPVQK
jgi:hypothetical protein